MPNGTSTRNRSTLSAIFFLFFIPLCLAWIQSPFSLFVFRDGFATHYPVKRIYLEQIEKGWMPYWNPSASFGQPLLANPNNLPFYPDNLLYLVFPFDVSWNFHFWFHWIFGSFGIFQLLKQFQRDSRIAVIGSLWWASSGFILSQFAFYNLIAAVSWIPWMVLALCHLFINPGVRPALILGLWTGFQFLAGEPVTCFSTWLLLCVFCLEWRKSLTIRTSAFLFLAAILSFVVVAPQLLALSEIYPYTSRSMIEHSFVTSSNSSLEPQRLLEWMVPYCWGIPFEKGPALFLGKAFSHFPFFVYSIHMSLLLLLSFFLGVRKASPVLVTAIGLFFLLLLGRFAPIWKLLFDYLPGFSNLRFPIKFYSSFLLLLIVVAAEGVKLLQEESSKQRTRALLFFTVIWLVSVVGYLITNHDLKAFFLYQIAIAGGMLLLLAAIVVRLQKWMLFFVIVEGLVGGRFLWLGVNKSDLLPARYNPVNTRIFVSHEIYPLRPDFQNATELYREESATAFPLWGATAGFRYAFEDSPEGLYSYYNDYLGGFAGSLPESQKLELFTRLGIDQVVTTQKVNPEEWEKTDFSLFYLYSAKKRSSTIFAAKSLVGGASPEKTLNGLLQSDSAFTRWKTEESRFVKPESLHYKEFNPSEYRIELKSSGPVFLVTRITFFPVWKATGIFSDGRVKTLKTNQVDLSFIGVEVPAGVERVTLGYQSRVRPGLLVIWGLIVTMSCVIAVARTPRLA
jgi:hypothetical protein